MEKEVRFDIQIQIMDMYRFMLRHAYRGIGGAANIIISGGALVMFIAGVGSGDAFARGLLLFTAALFTIINPLYLLFKSAKQVKLSPAFQKPLSYLVNSEGILVKQEAEELMIYWDEIRRTGETKRDIYIYLSMTRAYIFPKYAFADKVETFKELVNEFSKVKLKNKKK